MKSAEVLEVNLTQNELEPYIIKFRFVDSPATESYYYAVPANINIKILPVIGEIVQISLAADNSVAQHQFVSYKYYYHFPQNVHSNLNYNGVPNITKISNAHLSYKHIEAGISNKLNSNEIQTETISPIQPYSGDIIFEGRNGQTLHFSKITPEHSNQNNIDGDINSPYVILSLRSNHNNKQFVSENINDDDSSIYLTTKQTVDLNFSHNFLSLPKKINGKQIIINSDRIILNAKKSELILLAQNNVLIGSDDDIILDSSNQVKIQAPEIRLGNFPLYSSVNGEPLQTILTQLIEIINPLVSGAATPIQVQVDSLLLNSNIRI